jgi:hypothetical protein
VGKLSDRPTFKLQISRKCEENLVNIHGENHWGQSYRLRDPDGVDGRAGCVSGCWPCGAEGRLRGRKKEGGDEGERKGFRCMSCRGGITEKRDTKLSGGMPFCFVARCRVLAHI